LRTNSIGSSLNASFSIDFALPGQLPFCSA
jgi:hypothetical protein